jgi:hypothetical protein
LLVVVLFRFQMFWRRRPTPPKNWQKLKISAQFWLYRSCVQMNRLAGLSSGITTRAALQLRKKYFSKP